MDIHHLIDSYLQKPISISSIQEALDSIKDSKF